MKTTNTQWFIRSGQSIAGEVIGTSLCIALSCRVLVGSADKAHIVER